MLQQHLTVGLFLLSDLFLKGLASVIKGPSMLNASLGETLCVKCQYQKKYYNYNKYWCRGSNWGSCTYVVKTDGTEKEWRDGRNVIKDNQTEFEFTVRMENIAKEDAGIYWCAIGKFWASDPKWKVNITVITVTIGLPPTGITTTGYFSTTSTFPAETTEISSNSDFDLMILLPVVLGLLVLILGGTILLMWKLKKKKATKISKGPLPSTVSPSSDQATDGTEVAYTTVGPTQPFASQSQVSKNREKIDYASFRFSTLSDQPIYANA
ncbi:PREDICTED: CMRF35-like molecule 3 [Thamnophis sirtalis]|uniref:CMRF35-like molecule 3 n=1 Tax=Thamnophis sirtalis TaxID=35019 RepID=A0A6I9Z4V3_9SAUR|nr:PREDICTED: CMRF35-like molecule 3 [Thamnophis sirtalis]